MLAAVVEQAAAFFAGVCVDCEHHAVGVGFVEDGLELVVVGEGVYVAAFDFDVGEGFVADYETDYLVVLRVLQAGDDGHGFVADAVEQYLGEAFVVADGAVELVIDQDHCEPD